MHFEHDKFMSNDNLKSQGVAGDRHDAICSALRGKWNTKMACGHLRQFGTLGDVFLVHCLACETEKLRRKAKAVDRHGAKIAQLQAELSETARQLANQRDVCRACRHQVMGGADALPNSPLSIHIIAGMRDVGGGESITSIDVRQQCTCGSTKDLWFSRVEPMGYFCADCGEQDNPNTRAKAVPCDNQPNNPDQ